MLQQEKSPPSPLSQRGELPRKPKKGSPFSKGGQGDLILLAVFSLRVLLLTSLVASCLTLLSCILSKQNLLLEGLKLQDFVQDGGLTVYNRINLFDYMDGEAEAYLPFGFNLLYVSIFRHEKTDSRSVLEIYDMGTPEGAGGILKKYSSEGGSSFPGIGDSAWVDKGIVLFRQANYFVRIFPDPSPENEVRPTAQEMLDLARAIDSPLR